jgi:hypothetical protein
VITGVAKRTQISRDVNRTFAEKQTLGDRLADHVASFGGSWTFIALCLVALIAWTSFNGVVRAWQVEPFDPYPYIFLNLILSLLGPDPANRHARATIGVGQLSIRLKPAYLVWVAGAEVYPRGVSIEDHSVDLNGTLKCQT